MSLFTESTTIVSDAHKHVMDLLEQHGLEVMEEVPFPPYTADIYVPRFHMVVEVDGPQHSAKADTRKTRDLIHVYHLAVVRFKAGVSDTEVISTMDYACSVAVETAKLRYEATKLRAPWL